MTRLPYPYASKEESCTDTETSDFVNPLKYHQSYSYSACLQEGITRSMVKECGCAFFLYQGMLDYH